MGILALILLAIAIPIGIVLHRVLMLGGWGWLATYAVFHVGVTIWLFMQSSAGMDNSTKLALGLEWMAILFYLVVATILAMLRAVLLLADRATQPNDGA